LLPEGKGAAAGVGNLPYHFQLEVHLVAMEGNIFIDFQQGYMVVT